MSNETLLILSRTDIARLMDYGDYVDAVEAAFRAAAEGRAVAPPASALHVPGGSFHAKGAALLGDEAQGRHQDQRQLPGQSRGQRPADGAGRHLPRRRRQRPAAGGDGFDRGHDQPHRCRHHARRPPSRARRLTRGNDLRRRRPGPHPAQGHRRARQSCERVHVWDVDAAKAIAFAQRDVGPARPRHRCDGRSQPGAPERHRRHLQLGPPRLPHGRPRAARHLHRRRRRRQFRQVGDRSRPLREEPRRRRFAGAMRRDRRPASCRSRPAPSRTRTCMRRWARSSPAKGPAAPTTAPSPCSTAPAWGCRTSRPPSPSTDARCAAGAGTRLSIG